MSKRRDLNKSCNLPLVEPININNGLKFSNFNGCFIQSSSKYNIIRLKITNRWRSIFRALNYLLRKTIGFQVVSIPFLPLSPPSNQFYFNVWQALFKYAFTRIPLLFGAFLRIHSVSPRSTLFISNHFRESAFRASIVLSLSISFVLFSLEFRLTALYNCNLILTNGFSSFSHFYYFLFIVLYYKRLLHQSAFSKFYSFCIIIIKFGLSEICHLLLFVFAEK